jgi:hypothetical protein
MLSVASKPIMLSVVMLSVVAPYWQMFDLGEMSYSDKGTSLLTNGKINCKTF